MTTHAHVSFVESVGEQTMNFKNHTFPEGVGSQMIAFSTIPRGYFSTSHHLWPSALSAVPKQITITSTGTEFLVVENLPLPRRAKRFKYLQAC